MDEIFLFLNKYTNIGSVGFKKVLEYLDNKIEKFFTLKDKDFLDLGFSQKSVNKIFENLRKYNYHDEEKELNKFGIKICSILDEEYPYLLKQIPDAPIMFYYKGLLKRNENNLAIVGARKHSPYGKKIAEDFSSYLSNYFSIVSGFAYGIDSLAHNGAVKNKNRTIAVMGVGLDTYYPYQNKDLGKEILENDGLLISEFPINTLPLKINFPRRNRIISGLSNGVLIVEASLKSGTLITADFALEQGRDVFVIPGSIYSEFSLGANELIKKGANFVTNPNEIIEILNTKCRFYINKNNNIKREENILDKLNDKEKKIFNLLSYEPVNIENIFLETNISIKELNSILGLMEIRGNIQNLNGGYTRK